MEIQYGEFGQIIDRINTAGPLFKKNGRAYEKLFGGPFKRMDQITSEDEEFPEVKQLANKIESIITSVSEDLSHVGALENFLIGDTCLETAINFVQHVNNQNINTSVQT